MTSRGALAVAVVLASAALAQDAPSATPLEDGKPVTVALKESSEVRAFSFAVKDRGVYRLKVSRKKGQEAGSVHVRAGGADRYHYSLQTVALAGYEFFPVLEKGPHAVEITAAGSIQLELSLARFE